MDKEQHGCHHSFIKLKVKGQRLDAKQSRYPMSKQSLHDEAEHAKYFPRSTDYHSKNGYLEIQSSSVKYHREKLNQTQGQRSKVRSQAIQISHVKTNSPWWGRTCKIFSKVNWLSLQERLSGEIQSSSVKYQAGKFVQNEFHFATNFPNESRT